LSAPNFQKKNLFVVIGVRVIFKIFYPKILKEMIRQFERDDDLNKQVLKLLKGNLFWSLICGLVLLPAVIYKYNSWESYVLLIIGVVVLYKCMIAWVTNEMIVPYSLGERVSGVITRSHYGKPLDPIQPKGLRIISVIIIS